MEIPPYISLSSLPFFHLPILERQRTNTVSGTETKAERPMKRNTIKLSLNIPRIPTPAPTPQRYTPWIKMHFSNQAHSLAYTHSSLCTVDHSNPEARRR